MAEPFVQAASRLAECCALLAIGYNLKQAGILRASDGETAIKVATTLTLPSVIVQAFGNGGPLGLGSLSLLGVASVVVGAQLAATWLYCMQRSARERAVLAGSATGLSLRLYGYPVVECFLGGGNSAGAALQSVALLDVVNHLAVWIGGYLLYASAGPAFPESFKHEDGGDYRGQWRGMRKEGLGVYTYASGARYEGEWRNNVKEGRGVYYFPKGGVYEGEWSGGTMNGLGVRTFSTGQVKAGRWRDGQLEAPLELWQAALASDGATAVAAAARSVEVGGGRLMDAAHMLAAQPTLWALAAGIVVNLMHVPLPTSVELLTGVLAQANAPLMLLAAGITAPALKAPPGLKQLLPDIARLLGARLLVPLAVGLNLFALAAAGGDGGRVAATAVLPVAATMIGLLAPVPPEALANARRFRLNEATAAAIAAASCLTCLPLMLLAGVATALAGLAPPPPSAPAAAAAAADVRPLVVFAAVALAAVSAAVGYVSRQAEGPGVQGSGAAMVAAGAAGGVSVDGQRVRMVYVGPVETPRSARHADSTASTTEASEGAAGGGASAGMAALERGSQSGASASSSSSPSSTSASASEAGTGGSSGGGGGDAGGSGGGGGGGAGGGGAARSRLPPLQAALDAARASSSTSASTTSGSASCPAGARSARGAGFGCCTRVLGCLTAARRSAGGNRENSFGGHRLGVRRVARTAQSALGLTPAVGGGCTATVTSSAAVAFCGERRGISLVRPAAPTLSPLRLAVRQAAHAGRICPVVQAALAPGRASPVAVCR